MVTANITQNEELSAAARRVDGFFGLVGQLGPVVAEVDLEGSFTGEQVVAALQEAFPETMMIYSLAKLGDPECMNLSPDSPSEPSLLFLRSETPHGDVIITSPGGGISFIENNTYEKILLVGADFRGEKKAIAVDPIEEENRAVVQVVEALTETLKA